MLTSHKVSSLKHHMHESSVRCYKCADINVNESLIKWLNTVTCAVVTCQRKCCYSRYSGSINISLLIYQPFMKSSMERIVPKTQHLIFPNGVQ